MIACLMILEGGHIPWFSFTSLSVTPVCFREGKISNWVLYRCNCAFRCMMAPFSLALLWLPLLAERRAPAFKLKWRRILYPEALWIKDGFGEGQALAMLLFCEQLALKCESKGHLFPAGSGQPFPVVMMGPNEHVSSHLQRSSMTKE